MTKKYLTRLLQTSLMCCLAVLFTACDDMFATEDNPTSAYLGMSEKPVTIKVGETFQRQAIAAGTAVIEYTSSDTKVATVDNTGLVTAIAEGETTITATATGYSSQTGKKIYLPDSKSYKLTVKPATLPAATITTAPVATTGDIIAGSTTALVTAGEADGGTMMYQVTATNTKPTTTDGFSADIPLASNRAKGTYSVWYYAKGDDKHNNSEIAGPVAVTLKDVVAVTGVKLDETNLRYLKTSLSPRTLTATVSPADATDKSVTWTSSNENVATVDASGKVTPKAPGRAIITATTTDGGKKATCAVNIYDKGWNINNQGSATVPTGEFWLISGINTDVDKSITIGNGATVTLNGIRITQQIVCLGTATIYLADGSTNTVTVSTNNLAGIQIGAAGTLTINAETAGTGTLTAKGGSNAAGIGTSRNETGGNIVINGGTVTATGGMGAAGIGTGYAQGSTSTNKCDAITINGGTVTATGGMGAAGIGTGNANSSTSQNTCGAITINGGTVIATGGQWGAGIGTGNADHSASTNTCGAITIGAGVTSVTATKGTSSPNIIGKGYNYGSDTQKCGTITFGTAAVFDGTNWSPSDPLTPDTYGGLNLAISGKTWTLTPSN